MAQCPTRWKTNDGVVHGNSWDYYKLYHPRSPDRFSFFPCNEDFNVAQVYERVADEEPITCIDCLGRLEGYERRV